MAFTGYMFESQQDISSVLSKEADTVAWGKGISQRLNCCVQVGLPRKIGENLYNSICFVQPDVGTVVFYDKHFLYEQDEYWATEGKGFKSMPIQSLEQKRVGFGICMDVNPKKFEAPWDAYEFANFMASENAQLLSLSMAWLYSPRQDEYALARYWVSRLQPLTGKCVIVAVANRCGVEKGTKFAGNSCIMKFENGTANLLDILDETSEGLLICDC
ncbi:hypothetical protein SmJEL517_g02183 [Synchytrium microbalum]|uniref:CN hydrolase domain-containing protein n=1 Tax=Synchytrium microbalum TaxID=1806994 RepID=A0A507CBR3_9FUNG|nr:uncharacterized protein SmJEL517_g02183 [Synchytrium microbalum]TPX35446.1 hypothetical protein SmJEL517_g02183 [Synchytrium microbalum]